MTWTAIVPVKPLGARKTRLAGSLSFAERDRLSDALLAHVLAVLDAAPLIARVVVLSRDRPAGAGLEWISDHARGLNAELESAVETLGAGPVLVVHADLPLLACGDIAALLEAAAPAGAISPDRHGTGTNALALPDARGFRFAFGVDSFSLHRETLGRVASIVVRPGLALDIDEVDDLLEAGMAGFHY